MWLPCGSDGGVPHGSAVLATGAGCTHCQLLQLLEAVACSLAHNACYAVEVRCGCVAAERRRVTPAPAAGTLLLCPPPYPLLLLLLTVDTMA